jgi:Methyltransferase FkbM domain
VQLTLSNVLSFHIWIHFEEPSRIRNNNNRAAAAATTTTIQQQQQANRDHRQAFSCHHLATELRKRNMHRIDYMTIDTEGSEPEIIQDFPWHEFDVRVVQIEQLVASKYRSQKGKKELVIQHMEQCGYTLFSVFPVSPNDTDDLIFIRNTLLPNNKNTTDIDSTNSTAITTTLPTQPSLKWLQQYRTEKFVEMIKARQGGLTNTINTSRLRSFHRGGDVMKHATSRTIQKM